LAFGIAIDPSYKRGLAHADAVVAPTDGGFEGPRARANVQRMCKRSLVMTCRFISRIRAASVAIAMLLACFSPARAADPNGALMLVATPEFSDPIYGAAVLVAWPIGDGKFLGFIINKPTTVSVAEAFPEHAASQKVKDPIFLGGPDGVNAVFALVQSTSSPGRGSMQLSRDLFIVLAGETVDQVIEHAPEHARFLVGSVLWQSGELESEIEHGAWYVEPPDTGLMMRKETGNLWVELVQRLAVRRKAI
jgi:putative transcriptional regulator